MSKLKCTHIVNPVKVKETSDLYKAQPITFHTMEKAKAFAEDEVSVQLITTQYPEDREIIPNSFQQTPDLERSVMDVETFQKTRKLPLLHDILKRAVAFDPTSEYIIYTNVDIALQPHFYLFVKEQVEKGHEAFIINRRTIDSSYDMETLDAAYLDKGDEHPGYDCFVFKSSLFESFQLGTVCIGANWIGRTFYVNLLASYGAIKVFEDAYETFHIGEDGAWLINDFSEFDIHNKAQLLVSMNALRPIAKNTEVLNGIDAIAQFMEEYGITSPQQTKPPYKPSLWVRCKKKVKRIIKLLQGKD